MQLTKLHNLRKRCGRELQYLQVRYGRQLQYRQARYGRELQYRQARYCRGLHYREARYGRELQYRQARYGRELNDAHLGKASKKSSYLNFLTSMQDVPCAYLKKRNKSALMEQFIYCYDVQLNITDTQQTHTQYQHTARILHYHNCHTSQKLNSQLN